MVPYLPHYEQNISVNSFTNKIFDRFLVDVFRELFCRFILKFTQELAELSHGLVR